MNFNYEPRLLHYNQDARRRITHLHTHDRKWTAAEIHLLDQMLRRPMVV